MKKVRFIEPGGRPSSPYGHYVRQWPLMGPVILGTLLQERGHDVKIYNENISGPVLDDQEVMADLCEADVVGISIMTPTASRGYRISQSIRQRSGRPRIVLGGVHATFCPEEALRHADFVVTGEGERVIADIVEGRADPGIVRGQPVMDMDALPTPNHELIHEFSRLWAKAGAKELYRVPLVTSRGCPHNCEYCSVTALFGHRYRCRSAERVIQEIRTLYERGYRGFFFYDDNFTADRRRVRKILDAVRELGIVWNAQARLDFHWVDPRSRRRCDEPLLKAMRRSGGDVLYIGYETIEEETAREWKKGYVGAGTLEQRSAEDTRILHEAGFWIHGMFVLGPEHEESTLERIIGFAKRNRIESIQISALTPFPGTAIYEKMKNRLLFTSFPGDWDLYDGIHALYANTRMGIKRFQEKLLEAHREFYSHTALNLTRLGKFLRGPGSLFQKLRMFWANAGLPGQVLKAWEKETQEFLRRVAAIDVRQLWSASGDHAAAAKAPSAQG